MIDYLRAENRVLREQLGGRHDNQRRRLAAKAYASWSGSQAPDPSGMNCADVVPLNQSLLFEMGEVAPYRCRRHPKVLVHCTVSALGPRTDEILNSTLQPIVGFSCT